MKCDNRTEMTTGLALNSAIRDSGRWRNSLGGNYPPANADNIALIECHKCPSCGRSLVDEEIDGIR